MPSLVNFLSSTLSVTPLIRPIVLDKYVNTRVPIVKDCVNCTVTAYGLHSRSR